MVSRVISHDRTLSLSHSHLITMGHELVLSSVNVEKGIYRDSRHKPWIAEFRPSVIVEDHDPIRSKQPKSKYSIFKHVRSVVRTVNVDGVIATRLKFSQSLI